ncbi:MAG: hypothetical protein IJI98_08220 [Methanosphaera sp.]|nr:hypothetical protein [Methanosphaera sp.]
MKKEGLIIIGVIVAVLCIGAGAYLLYNSSPEYMNITMNGVTFEVPKSNVTVLNQTEHYSIYNDTEKGVAIFVFDSTDATLSDMSEAASFAGTRDAFQIGAQLQQKSNITYNHSDTMKVYTYLTNYGHKNVFIITKNKEDMEHILSSINVNSVNYSLNETSNSTNDTGSVEYSNSMKKSSSSGSEIESEKVKENLQAGDGSYYREVTYKDGNFRQYDTNGKLIGSSYDSDQGKLRELYGSDIAG